MSRPGKRDARAVVVDLLPFTAPAGHTKYHRDADGDVTGLQFGCPCGCGAHFGATFAGPNAWTWNGDEAAPTVNPSLGCGRADAGGGFHWHGFLRAGVYEEC